MLFLPFLLACATAPKASYWETENARLRAENQARWAHVEAENQRMTELAARNAEIREQRRQHPPAAVAAPAPAAPPAQTSEACRDLKSNKHWRQIELEKAEQHEAEMCAKSRPQRVAFVAKYGDTRVLRAQRAAWDAEHCENVVVRQTKRTDLVVQGRNTVPVERVWADTKLVCKGERPPYPIDSRNAEIAAIAIENQNAVCASADYLARQRGEEVPAVEGESKLEKYDRLIAECHKP